MSSGPPTSPPPLKVRSTRAGCGPLPPVKTPPLTSINGDRAGRPDNGTEKGGKVQTVELRIPGKSKAIYALARMDSDGGKAHLISSDKGLEMLGRLSWLLAEAGTLSLKMTFDSVHPPVNLREHLLQPHVKSVLQRLQQQGVLSEKQWKILYPLKKRNTNSGKYDSRTLITLLETVCHLCPPYPNGWMEVPLPTDKSLSADIVRLQLFYQQIAAEVAIQGEHFAKLWTEMCDVLIRLGGKQVKPKIDRIEMDPIAPDTQQRYIQQLRETWGGLNARKLMKIHSSRSKSTKSRRSYATNKSSEYEGLPPEDRVTLMKTYKVLVDGIQAEDILDRLQQSQVIKFSDRQEILALSKNPDRMQLLLDKVLHTKMSYAFKALCDAIKFKYKKVYENVMTVRKITYKEGVVTTVDVVGVTHDALCMYYRNAFSRLYPFPWSESVHATIRDIYTPLEIVTDEGKKLHSSELLPASVGNGKGQRILLEGPGGSGKSTLCAWLAFLWATQPTYFKQKYALLLYLDLNSLEGQMESAIYSELMPDNFKLSQDEFWSTLEANAASVLVVVDAYDQTPDTDISDILAGTRLKKSTVLVAVNPDNMAGNQAFIPDHKWFNLGFSETNVKRCLKNCVSMSRLENTDPFEKLYKLAAHEQWDARQQLFLPQLTVLLFATFYVLRRTTLLREMKTAFDVLEKYGVAMAVYFCRRQKIDIIGFEFPDEILRAIEQLDKFAYKCLLEKKTVFTEEEVLQNTQTPMVLKFGAFSKLNQSGTRFKFPSTIVVDFLAAKHMADMNFGDMENAVLQRGMLKLPKYTQTMSFLCGQYKDDTDTPVLRTLFEQLAARNEYCIRGQRLPTPSSVSVADADGAVKLPRGVLHDFNTSLQCLTECHRREDAQQVVAESLPPKLIVKLDGMLSLKTVQGLCLALAHEDCLVCEIDIELHQYHFQEIGVLSRFSTAIGQMKHLRALKIVWSSLDAMAKYLVDITTRTQSLERVVLTEDLAHKPVRHVTAATWAALQSACQNMTSVRQLSFFNGRVPAIVNHVMQHIPDTIEEVNFRGCAMNLMIAGELRGILEDSPALRSLDLSDTRLNSTEFVAVMHGLKLSEGIKTLRLRGARMDRSGVTALSECLKLTHTLECLDLSDCELTTDMCMKLASALKMNRTLKRLIVKNTKVTSEGRHVISHTNVQQVNVVGLQALY